MRVEGTGGTERTTQTGSENGGSKVSGKTEVGMYALTNASFLNDPIVKFLAFQTLYIRALPSPADPFY